MTRPIRDGLRFIHSQPHILSLTRKPSAKGTLTSMILSSTNSTVEFQKTFLKKMRILRTTVLYFPDQCQKKICLRSNKFISCNFSTGPRLLRGIINYQRNSLIVKWNSISNFLTKMRTLCSNISNRVKMTRTATCHN